MKKGLILLPVILAALVLVVPSLAQAPIACTGPLFQPDGRINAWHQCAPIAAYPDGAGGLLITWAVGEDYHMGDLALHVLAEDVAAAMLVDLDPLEQVLITEGNGIMIYLTAEGMIKIEIPGEYGFEFDGGLLQDEPDDWGREVLPDAYGNRGFI